MYQGPIKPANPMGDSEFAAKHPTAAALRNEGYIPLPRLWIKAEAISEVHEIASRFTDDVNRIRHEVRNGTYVKPSDKPDPMTDKEAAWAAFEAAQGR